MYYLITLGTEYQNDAQKFKIHYAKTKSIMKKQIKKLYSVYDPPVAEYIHNITILGDKNAKHLWIFIMIYHEIPGFTLYNQIENDNIQNAISALIFSESEEEAIELIRKHPKYINDIENKRNEYLKDIGNNLRDENDMKYLKEIETMSALDYCINGKGLCY
jgi:hypothetical protein